MKYKDTLKPGSLVELEVSLDQKEFLQYWQPVYDRALASVELKGFRAGMAPKDLADKAVDKEKVFEHAVSDVVRETLRNITQEKEWELIDQPKIEVLESDPLADKGLKFKTTLTLFPQVQLGDYKKISRRIFEEQKPVAIDEKEIEKSIDWIRNSRAKMTRVSRPTKTGDVVDLDFEGFIDGKSLDGAQSKGDRFVLGEGKFIPGFEEHILNHKEGDHVEFSIEFPKDYWKKDLQGKKVDFQTDIRGIFERELPELTDEFVKDLGNFATVADFHKNVREGLQKEKEEKERERLQLKVLEAVGKAIKVEIPQVMIDRTAANLQEEYRAYRGAKVSEEEMRAGILAEARTNVLNNLVLFQIAKQEGLEPSKEEVEAEANKFLAHDQFSKKPKIDPQRLYDYIYGVVRNKKVFEHLEKI